MSDNPSALIQFIGRLHPLLVHLPIGFILLLAAMEALALQRRFKHVASASGTIIALTLPAVILSAACGWLLSWSGGYDEQTLWWHKWLGVSLTPAVLILAILHWRGRMKPYRVWLAATVALLVATGHFGGSLTHGSDYLLVFGKKSPAIPSAMAPVRGGGQSAFSAVVQPLFNDYCVSCHGPNKSKGKLRLDTADNIFRGGTDGPVVVRGDTVKSELIKRLMLPKESDDHMPPSGKRQPSPEQIALLKWWINIGAPVDKTIEELKMPEEK
jgi:uncharacterized membrane protein